MRSLASTSRATQPRPLTGLVAPSGSHQNEPDWLSTTPKVSGRRSAAQAEIRPPKLEPARMRSPGVSPTAARAAIQGTSSSASMSAKRGLQASSWPRDSRVGLATNTAVTGGIARAAMRLSRMVGVGIDEV